MCFGYYSFPAKSDIPDVVVSKFYLYQQLITRPITKHSAVRFVIQNLVGV